jgi:hypothetical protein
LEDSSRDSERRKALADLRRLSSIILDNLADGSQRRLIDAREMRLLGGTAMKSIRLWLAEIDRDREKELDKIPGDSTRQGCCSE